MLFQYTKTKKTKTTEVLNDLIRIHNDRIAGYQLVLESVNTDYLLRDTINELILEGIEYKQQLSRKVRQTDDDAAKGTTLLGKIYRVWIDLKIKFACSTRKAIISSCEYNEEIALHVYSAALNEAGIEPDVRMLLEDQEAALRQTLNLIKSFKEVRHFVNSSLIYFN